MINVIISHGVKITFIDNIFFKYELFKLSKNEILIKILF